MNGRAWRLSWCAVALAVVVLEGIALAAQGTITISKCIIREKDEENEITSGDADADLAVYFESEASCTCGCEDLEYTWDFGDGTTEEGADVSHAYGAAGGGSFSISVSVECTDCGATNSQGGLSVNAITGIDPFLLGDTNRLCFNTHTEVHAHVLPDLPESCDEKIDWTLDVGTYTIMKLNDDNTNMDLPEGSWPTSNSAWGQGTVMVYIDEGCMTSQDDELITGAASYISNSATVHKYYNATSSENPTDAPNWFYYYRSEYGGTYAYGNPSQSLPGGGEASIQIGDEAYSGHDYHLWDYGNPGGRLRITGHSGTFRYYAAFVGVVEHERQHANNEVAPPNPNDPDNDFLTTAFENGTSRTNPNVTNSADPGSDDGESYASSVVEGGAILGANTANDWAHPGTNWNP